MNKFFSLLLTTVFCISCEMFELTLSPTEQVEFEQGVTPVVPSVDMEQIYGKWAVIKTADAENGEMTDWDKETTGFMFSNDGKYKSIGYWGEIDGTFVIDGMNIIVYQETERHSEFEVLKLDDKSLRMKATFEDTETPVWILCETFDENGYVDITPKDSVSVETIWNKEELIGSATLSSYSKLSKFVSSQYKIESDILANKRENLREHSSLLCDTWSEAYSTINFANDYIKAISANCPLEWAPKYESHLRAVRAFVYYNLIVLWGDLPYIDEDSTYDYYTDYPYREDVAVILDRETESLIYAREHIDEAFEGNSVFTRNAIDVLLAEMYMYKKEYAQARRYLENVSNELSSDEPIFTVENMAIYLPTTVSLYLQETYGETASLVENWTATEMPQYGYWAMLLRTGMAREVTLCKKHETLLPIPITELAYNPHITQNPGY